MTPVYVLRHAAVLVSTRQFLLLSRLSAVEHLWITQVTSIEHPRALALPLELLSLLTFVDFFLRFFLGDYSLVFQKVKQITVELMRAIV